MDAQFNSVAQLCLTLCDPCTAACQTSLSITNSQSLLKLTSRACSNSCPLSQWCHPTIPSSVPCFSSCLQPFPASGSFPVSRLSTSGGQSIRASASALVLLVNIQDLFPLWLTGLISLQSKDSQESSPVPQFESISSLVVSLLYGPTLTSVHDYWKNHSFHYRDLCQQRDVSAFNMLSRLVITFLPRSKHL